MTMTMMSTPTPTPTSPPTPAVSPAPSHDLEGRLDRMAAALEALAVQQRALLENQQRITEVWREAAPILKDMMAAGTTHLAALEERGYFRAGRAALDILDRVIVAYSEDDLARFSEAAVSILDTVRNLTQPEVLAIANEASSALAHADALAPLGMGGMLRASREDDVQRGMAVFLELLRHVGRASSHLHAPGDAPRLPAPARRPSVPAAPAAARTSSSSASASAATAPTMPEVEFMGARFQGDGTLLEPEKWTRELAEALAPTVGVETLTAEHWVVLDFARKEFAETSHSPNIRRLTEGSGIDTRRIYALFPQAPGRAVARVAGLPKPAGCI